MRQQDKELQFQRMTTEPVYQLVGRLSVPTILSMLVTNIYNMVDTAFVGQFGNSASGAVGIVFGFMSILQAVGFLCGQGSGSIMARKLGAQQRECATVYASTGFFLSFLIGALVAVLSWCFLTPLLHLLGSTSTIEPYARVYITFIILAAPFLTSSLSLNNLLRYEGKARLGTIGLMTGAVLNICGDWLFMFVLDMKVAGAGLSTALSQFISFCILLFMFLSGKTQTQISLRHAAFRLHEVMNILTTGFPSLLRNALNSISTMLLNSGAAVYGDEAVAAMSIVSRVSFFVMSIAIGMGQGFQPVSGFNYGAKRYDRVKQAFWFTLSVAEVLLLMISIPVFVNAEAVVRLFRDDNTVVLYAVRALRLQCVTLLLVPPSMMTEMGFQSTGQRALASFSSSLRSGLLLIPTLIILPKLRGFAGIQEAQPVSFLLSFIICLYLTRVFLSRLKD